MGPPAAPGAAGEYGPGGGAGPGCGPPGSAAGESLPRLGAARHEGGRPEAEPAAVP